MGHTEFIDLLDCTDCLDDFRRNVLLEVFVFISIIKDESNSILLDSKISLANFERNYFLAQFKLLQAIGLLNIDHLKLQ